MGWTMNNNWISNYFVMQSFGWIMINVFLLSWLLRRGSVPLSVFKQNLKIKYLLSILQIRFKFNWIMKKEQKVQITTKLFKQYINRSLIHGREYLISF